MPINFDRFLKKIVTYWAVQTDNFGGFSFTAPVTIKARWEDRVENLITPDGESFISKSKVWVASDVEVGGYLYQGESVVADATTLTGAHRIQMFGKIPDIRGTRFERKATL